MIEQPAKIILHLVLGQTLLRLQNQANQHHEDRGGTVDRMVNTEYFYNDTQIWLTMTVLYPFSDEATVKEFKVGGISYRRRREQDRVRQVEEAASDGRYSSVTYLSNAGVPVWTNATAGRTSETTEGAGRMIHVLFEVDGVKITQKNFWVDRMSLPWPYECRVERVDDATWVLHLSWQRPPAEVPDGCLPLRFGRADACKCLKVLWVRSDRSLKLSGDDPFPADKDDYTTQIMRPHPPKR